jgi:hypothetical protein
MNVDFHIGIRDRGANLQMECQISLARGAGSNKWQRLEFLE